MIYGMMAAKFPMIAPMKEKYQPIDQVAAVSLDRLEHSIPVFESIEADDTAQSFSKKWAYKKR
jgi:hypothetical protein